VKICFFKLGLRGGRDLLYDHVQALQDGLQFQPEHVVILAQQAQLLAEQRIGALQLLVAQQQALHSLGDLINVCLGGHLLAL